jgi:gamma-glutamyl-gamma-aminobutyrate hydrolase PuuD
LVQDHATPPTRPIIGLVSRRIPFTHQDRPYPRYGVAISYCEAVEGAGGSPVIFPLTRDRQVLDACFGLIDGLLLSGGQDVHPMHYGEEPHRSLEQVDPLRDITELYLCKKALAADMPILAICRGEQILNVASGGTLFQDVHEEIGKHCLRHFQDFTEEWPSHSIQVQEGTRLRDIVGDEKVMVNSYHHQAVRDLGPGFRVSALAPDGVVEAIESTRHTFALGVQWHPELLYDNRDFNMALFRQHVEHAGRHAHARAT